MSNYPNGFSNGLVVRGAPVDVPHPGKVFWVNNSGVLPEKGISGSNGNDGTYLRPFSTIDYAVGRCTANRGDIIYVMPGHVEDIAAAASVAIDVAGISIIGLGKGAKQARFDFTATAGTVTVDADNVSIVNMNFHANVSAVAIGLSVLTLATDLQVKDCVFDVEATTTDEFLISINVGVGCDRILIEDCKLDMGLGGAAVGVKFVGATAGATIRRNRMVGDYSTAIINGITTLSTELYIEDNLFVNGGAGNIGTEPAIELLTGSTGVISDNYIVCNLATKAASIVADTCLLFENYYNEDITGTGGLIGAVSADD